jgi:signal transduction histidine kinase/ligand-binding sensor domain-containing protein
VFQIRFFTPYAFLLLLTLTFSVVFSQLDQPFQSTTEITGVEAAPVATITDNATLNLHRWGAVTLFHGLPSDRVNAIAEDATGILWFGTDNGLVSYDGRNIEAAPNEASLPSRRILALKLDARGNLWIGTDAGAARMREKRIEVLTESRNRQITAIASSPQGETTLVTTTGEIIRYQEQTDQEFRSERTAQNRLTATKLDQTTHALLKSPNQSNETLPLAAITFSTAGDWLIGSSGRGLLVNRANDLREATIKPPRPYFIASVYDDGARVWLAEQASLQVGGLWIWSNGSMTRTSLEAGAITAVHGGNGELWVATARRGAFLLKPESDDVKQIEHLTFDNTAGGLRSNRINTVFRDREGIIWFGTDRGVCRYDRNSFRASQVSANSQSNYVRIMLHTANGETWCGANRGLFRLGSSANETGSDSWVEVGELQGRSIYALTEDASGAIWVGTSNGLFVKSKNDSGFSRISSAPDTTITITNESETEQLRANDPLQPDNELNTPQSQSPNQQSRESVRAIAVFRGQIYAAVYERGIERIDHNQEGFVRVPVLTETAAQRAICFAVEGNEALWFGTTDGELRRFDGSQTVSINLPDKQSAPSAGRAVRAIGIAGSRIWIGISQGLYLREGDAVREIRSGIDVQSLLISRDTVWCATKNAGLIKLFPDQNISARFDTEQGLPSQQVFAIAPGAEGEIWIGTNRGVVRHRPSAIEPRLQVKRLLADQIYLPEYLMAELSLPHTQQNFLLEVVGIGSRTFPSQFQYEFILLSRRGREIKRVQTHDPQFAVEGLQSGAYSIAARAISRDLVYSAPLNIRLRIRDAPFPWSTLLLASLLALAVVAAIWAFRQQLRLASANRALEKTNVELRETRLRLASETEAERSRIARDLHDQTLADLRHLLVLTDQLPASNGDESTPSPTLIRKEIEAISSEIRHICEDLSPSALENLGFLPALEWALSDAVAHLATEEKFAYEFICEPNLEDRLQLSHIEQIQLYRIVQEALNNICRHAKAKNVKLSVRTEGASDLVIEICDDGIGFDGAMITRTGHGIANIRSRANLIGARVEWNNARPGCRFEVRNPQSAIQAIPAT